MKSDAEKGCYLLKKPTWLRGQNLKYALPIISFLWRNLLPGQYLPSQLFDLLSPKTKKWSLGTFIFSKLPHLLKRDNELSLLVAHDAVNKTLICKILGIDYSNIWMIKQGNGGITIIDLFNDPNKPPVISALNITTHLGGILDSTASGAL